MELETRPVPQSDAVPPSENTAVFRAAWTMVQQLIRQGKPVFLAIDGRCGSGKTWLAAWLRTAFDCGVVHMDDFYLPPNKRGKNWRENPGGNLDFERLRREAILPLQAGEPACFRPFDCRKGRLGEETRLPPHGVTIVEGSYSMHPALAGCYAKTLFLTCSKEEQTRRLRAREGERFRTFQELWIPLEERYFRQYGIEKASDLVLNTGPLGEDGTTESEHQVQKENVT